MDKIAYFKQSPNTVCYIAYVCIMRRLTRDECLCEVYILSKYSENAKSYKDLVIIYIKIKMYAVTSKGTP